MQKLLLRLIGVDSFSRPVYQSLDGNLFKDTNLGSGELSLCTVYGGFDGEPDTPIKYMKKYQNVMVEIITINT